MESIIPDTSKRVAENTSAWVNDAIIRETLFNLEAIGNNPAKIEARLRELDREWDIERALEANAASVALMGLALGATANRRWYFLPAVVAGFLLQHAVQGWCPPVPLMRRLGFRTQREIENERAILRARRGDFDVIKESSSIQAIDMLNT